jgi:hypothetical protein
MSRLGILEKLVFGLLIPDNRQKLKAYGEDVINLLEASIISHGQVRNIYGSQVKCTKEAK